MEVLSCNRQHVEIENGWFHYRGWEVGGMEGLRHGLEPIAQAVAAAISGLCGYCGIDFLLSEEGPLVLDVNPRLTTTYAALRETIGCNPAALVLGLRPLNLPRSPFRPTPLNLGGHA